jgi:hypothetical protein
MDWIWMLGVGAILAVVVIATLAVGWERGELPTALWDVSRMSASFTTVVGSLAGLSVASAIFLANLTAIRQSPDFGLVMAMFLIAFTILIATSMLFATVPNLPAPADDPEYGRLQRTSYLLAVMSYALGLAVAWFAIRPLLLALDLTDVAAVFIWILFVSLLGATLRVAMNLSRHGGYAAASVATLGVVGIGLPILYRALAVALPELWPTANAPFVFTVLAFAVGTFGFMSETVLHGTYGRSRLATAALAYEHRIVLGYGAATIATSTFLWLGVAF